MAVTRADVARLAGVSPSTVTYVLTGQRPVSERTRERVRQAVERLGYRPNHQAASLASTRARNVGVLLRMERATIEIGDLSYIDGVREGVEPGGLQVVVPMGLRVRPEDNLVSLVRSRSIDSVILMDVAVHDEREAFLLEERVPTVLIGTSEREGGAPSIDADFEHMATIAVEHLAALGHRRLLMPLRRRSVENSRAYLAQHAALEKAVAASGLSAVVRYLPESVGLGGQLIGPDGLVDGCTAALGNNPAVLTGIKAAGEALGLRVPEDYSLMVMAASTTAGVDGDPLTRTDVHSHSMGRAAGHMLLRLLQDSALDEHVLVKARISDHGSTGSVPRRAR